MDTLLPGNDAPILIIDDSKENVGLLCSLFHDEGYEVLVTTEGKLGIESAKKAHPALIFLDINMPTMDGYEVCEKLKEEATTKEIPVIFISGLSEPLDKVRAFEVGGIDYIMKPFELEEVLARTRTHISHSRLGRELRRLNDDLEHGIARRTAELQHERDFSTAILNTAGALILVMDSSGNILVFNRACEIVSGYTGEEIVGSAYWEKLLPAEDKEPTRQIFGEKHGRSFPGTLENTWLTKNGHCRLISWSNSIFSPPGEDERYLIAIGSDITEQRHAEAQAALQREQLIRADKLSSLGTLVAGMAHEINNPNNFILLNADNLKEICGQVFGSQTPASSELVQMAKDATAHIREGSIRIKNIVRDLRTYAKDSTSDMTQLVQLSDVIHSASGLLTNAIRNGTDNFLVEAADDLPPVKGNFQRLEQVLINLIQNALHALPGTSSGITVTTCHDKQLKQVILCVRDQGHGIPSENLPKVTDPFFTTKRDTGGTGLGLSICSAIIDEHGGTIAFQSNSPSGTLVTITLPEAPISTGKSP